MDKNLFYGLKFAFSFSGAYMILASEIKIIEIIGLILIINNHILNILKPF